MVTRGFTGRPRTANDRVPPGQYVVDDFPVLTAGPTIGVTEDEWELTVTDGTITRTYDWEALHALSIETITVDIHCVTHWSKLDTDWEGVQISTLFEDAGVGDYGYTLISSYGDYTTNVPVADLMDHDALIATRYGGEAIDAESMAALPDFLSPTCTCGRAQNGCTTSGSWMKTSQDSGKPPATTFTATHGASSATTPISGHHSPPTGPHMAHRNRQ